ncbi:MAG: hypothetical protein WDM87_10705 [Terracidiphilus sp.]
MNIRSLAGSARALAVIALVLMITGSTAMFGQQITGTLVGTVKDGQGAVINTADREGDERGYWVYPVGAC